MCFKRWEVRGVLEWMGKICLKFKVLGFYIDIFKDEIDKKYILVVRVVLFFFGYKGFV